MTRRTTLVFVVLAILFDECRAIIVIRDARSNTVESILFGEQSTTVRILPTLLLPFTTLGRTFSTFLGVVQKPGCLDCIPCSMVDMLETVRAEMHTAEPPCHDDQYAVDFLYDSGEQEDAMDDNADQYRQEVCKPASCSSLAVIVVVLSHVRPTGRGPGMVDLPW